ncbi:PDR/VanB family oxidoreductase [Burkholderia contaminans]|uniref:PDR/VanB family oxidoreductase n=1 Tax=Burkholderia contaminans TaxID=488447 RepID=UPI0008F532D9|nr:PDR/VanB family oxidoreductase [Burkholderia contaminans]
MWLTVRVARKTVEAEGIAGFEFVEADGRELPAFCAGAHVDVRAPGGLVRQYSLCNRPGERHRYQIGVLRDPASRGGSVAMHDDLKEGDTLQISPPKNNFPLVEDANRSLLFAGGIGVTPILAMAERLHELARDFAVHYATRSPTRTAFADRIRSSRFAAKVQFHHDDGADGQKLNLPPLLKSPQPGTHLYVCGPKGFLEAVRAQATDAGWPEGNVHYEYFAGVEAHSVDHRHFDVVIKSSGAVIRVEAMQTVVQALEANGVFVPVSCEQGVCGTCLTRVLAGEVDHKDLYLTAEEQAAHDQFLPCCSRAKGNRLVLDL